MRAILPSRIPTSAGTAGVPSPSMTDPPVITTSKAGSVVDLAQPARESNTSARH